MRWQPLILAAAGAYALDNDQAHGYTDVELAELPRTHVELTVNGREERLEMLYSERVTAGTDLEQHLRLCGAVGVSAQDLDECGCVAVRSVVRRAVAEPRAPPPMARSPAPHRPPPLHLPPRSGALRTEFLEAIAADRAARLCEALPLGDVARCAERAAASIRQHQRRFVETSDLGTPCAGVAEFEAAAYAPILDELSARAAALQYEYVEGGFWAPNLFDGVHRAAGTENVAVFALKRECYLARLLAVDAAAGGAPWVLGEVGGNAGHSAAMVLATFPHASVEVYDLCEHAYTVPNFEYLQGVFGKDRVSLACGDSRATLADAHRRRGAAAAAAAPRWDAVHIDGGHDFEVAAADLLNARALSKPGALVVLDDCALLEVGAAWEMAKDLDVVETDREGLCWKSNCYGTYR